MAILESLASNVAYDFFKKLFSNDEVDEKLWEYFGNAKGTLPEPTGMNLNDEPRIQCEIPQDIEWEVVDIHTTKGSTIATIRFDDELREYLPEEKKLQNSLNFFMQNTNVNVFAKRNTRLGPVLQMTIDTTEVGEVNVAILATVQVFSRIAHEQQGYLEGLFELTKSGQIPEERFETLAPQGDVLSSEDMRELAQFLSGSIAGLDPEKPFQEDD